MNRNHYPSLLVVTNREHTIWYKVLRDKAEKLTEYETEDPKFSDNEGYFEKGTRKSRGKTGKSETYASGSVREEDPHKMHAAEEHLKDIAEKTRGFWQDGSYEHLMVARPTEIKGLVKQEFKKKKVDTNYKEIEGNYTHSDRDKILKIAKDSLKVV